jgi:hypothetical protein
VSQPAPIPQYLLILGIIVMIAGVVAPCTFNITGCQPSVFPLNPDRKPIFPIRKKHAAPSGNPASKESSTSNGAAPINLPPVAAAEPATVLSMGCDVAGVDVKAIVERQRLDIFNASKSMTPAERKQYRAHVEVYFDEVDNGGKEAE